MLQMQTIAPSASLATSKVHHLTSDMTPKLSNHMPKIHHTASETSPNILPRGKAKIHHPTQTHRVCPKNMGVVVNMVNCTCSLSEYLNI
ncbi:hypothetical protein IAQ61_000591 [Plenodomus lingam]|uniref:uncharacterized protein n=1 Tax=Leptosphaeria maculans TaxID=5022 RepID=UPI0033274BA0|nr:hypothetical protein IAQ61_000591 [Plenodomus lingam]